MSARPFTLRDAAALGVIAALAVGAASACFSEHVTDTAGTTTGTCVLPPVASGTTVVIISSFAFSPTPAHVKAGNSIAWVNCEPTAIPHTSTSDAGRWDTGTITQGRVSVQAFSSAGTFPYHCAIHPSMKGTVIADP